jgi:hypothetical protein
MILNFIDTDNGFILDKADWFSFVGKFIDQEDESEINRTLSALNYRKRHFTRIRMGTGNDWEHRGYRIFYSKDGDFTKLKEIAKTIEYDKFGVQIAGPSFTKV